MKSDAWLMDCGAGLRIAVGDREMVELVRQRNCHRVPGSPAYVRDVLEWQGRAVPVMDIARLHGAQQDLDGGAYISILNYRDGESGELLPVGIRVSGAPARIVVDDRQVRDWPAQFADSRLLAAALCCFEHDGNAVLILDIARLCSAGFRDLAAAAA